MKLLLPAFVVALLLAAPAAAAPPPDQMIGKWTRTVTSADVHRAGARTVVAGTTWTLVIGRSGSSATHGTRTMRGHLVQSNATQVNIEIGQQKPNLYDWRRAGSKLILHMRFDPVADRAAVLTGTWVKHTG
jgi:hypothetical protein